LKHTIEVIISNDDPVFLFAKSDSDVERRALLVVGWTNRRAAEIVLASIAIAVVASSTREKAKHHHSFWGVDKLIRSR
jgi:hypothetical protein